MTSKVKLPPGANPPLRVFVNGVAQKEGQDYVLAGRELVFEDRLLKKEGKLGFLRWTSIFLGLVGSYKQNDSVDVHWTGPDGNQQVAVYLDIELENDQP